jgi:uncharacterized protein (DUF1697 family)
MNKVNVCQYLALLRGINVGGNNIIKMTDLKMCFEQMGFADVMTYIQSDNIPFRSDEQNRERLTDKIERILSDTFHYGLRVVIITHKQLKSVVEDAPSQFGKDASCYRYDAIFLKEPLTAKTAIKSVSVKDGVDRAYEGKVRSISHTLWLKQRKAAYRNRHASSLSEHDHSELEHNHNAARFDGQERSGRTRNTMKRNSLSRKVDILQRDAKYNNCQFTHNYIANKVCGMETAYSVSQPPLGE